MKTYTIRFKGCAIGSIGKLQGFTVKVQAENEQEAVLKLYDTYSHITQPMINGKLIQR